MEILSVLKLILCSGSFSITATDINSCNTFIENVIVYDSSFTPSSVLTSTNISCFGLNDGHVEAMITSGSNTTGGNISNLTYLFFISRNK